MLRNISSDLSDNVIDNAIYTLVKINWQNDAPFNTDSPNSNFGTFSGRIEIPGFLLSTGEFSPSPIIDGDNGERRELTQGIARQLGDGDTYDDWDTVANPSAESRLITFADDNDYTLLKHVDNEFQILESGTASSALSMTFTADGGNWDIEDTSTYVNGDAVFTEFRVRDIVNGEVTPIFGRNSAENTDATNWADVTLSTYLTGTNTNWRVEMFVITDQNDYVYNATVNPTIA